MNKIAKKVEEEKETENDLSIKPDFILEVNADRSGKKKIKMGIREIDEETYRAAQALFKSGNDVDAIKVLVTELRVSGAPVTDITENFLALKAAAGPLYSILEPLEGKLKKNESSIK